MKRSPESAQIWEEEDYKVKGIFKVFVVMLFLFTLVGCSSKEREWKEESGNEKTDKVEVYSYDGDSLEFKKISISPEKQQEVFGEIKKLTKSGELYIDGEYQGLESAYNENTYLIKIFEGTPFTIEIIEDKPYFEDKMYWYNVKSEDKNIEGIYKTSYNLKERVDHIISK